MSGELPPAPSEARFDLLIQLNIDRRIAMEGGPVVSRDAWARIDGLLDCLNELVMHESGAASMLDEMVFDQDRVV